MIKPNYDLVTEILEEDASYQHLVHDKQELANLYRAAETWMVWSGNAWSQDRLTLQFHIDVLKRDLKDEIVALFMSEMDK